MQADAELADHIRIKSRVHTESVVVAARLARAIEDIGYVSRCTETGAAEETRLLREISEGRERKDVVLVNRVGDLSCVERRRNLVLDALPQSLRQKEILSALRIECAEEPYLIFLDRSADVEASVNLREALRNRTREGRKLHVANQAPGGKEGKGITGNRVAAGFRDDVEDAARRLAVLSAISAGLNLYFLHELERKVRARSAKRGVGRVHAVEDVVVLRT